MPGAHQQTPISEKLVLLIGKGLEREYMGALDIAEIFDCSYKTANRLMLKLYSMKHELNYITCSKIGTGKSHDPIKIKVRLNKKWS